MQAVILAAGMGKRLKELTKDNTKCMVKVNGETLIARMLRQLGRHDLSRIVIVVGYKKQALIEYIDSLDTDLPHIVYIDNPIYDKTNNIYSLSLAKEYLCAEDTLLFESDLIFEDSVLDLIVNDPYENIALVDKYESWMDGTCLTLDDQNHIVSFISGDRLSYEDRDEYYKTVNIYKFSKNFSKTYFVPFLEAYLSALGENEYYEQVLKVIAMVNSPVIEARRLSGQLWYEIDDIQDLDIAESIFIHNDEEKLELFQKRYGGYWRYPKLLDYCYLVNPYFPPQQMIDEMRASFDTLLTEYPSGMRVNQLLASKFFNVRPENILVGNGAAELIKVLMDGLQGSTGLIRSSFEEYPNRTDPERSVCFYPEGPDYFLLDPHLS
jgi:choline kinase